MNNTLENVDCEVEKIRARLKERDLLLQLAEESAELAQAALKTARVLAKTNPTPVTFEGAWDNLVEEYADVLLSARAMAIRPTDAEVVVVMDKKSRRWASRLGCSSE